MDSNQRYGFPYCLWTERGWSVPRSLGDATASRLIARRRLAPDGADALPDGARRGARVGTAYGPDGGGLADTSSWFRRLVHKSLRERANGFALRRSAHQKINAHAHREERFAPQVQCGQPLPRLEWRHDVQLVARRKMAGERAERSMGRIMGQRPIAAIRRKKLFAWLSEAEFLWLLLCMLRQETLDMAVYELDILGIANNIRARQLAERFEVECVVASHVLYKFCSPFT